MNIIGKSIAVTHGYVDDRGYGRGVWMTWERDGLGMVGLIDVYDDEVDALRAAVTDGVSIAFVPYRQGRWYVHQADLGALPTVEAPQ